MSTITRYVLVNRDDIESDYEYDTYHEALEGATKDGAAGQFAIIERQYVYDDAELVWTPNGRNSWPPHKATRLR